MTPNKQDKIYNNVMQFAVVVSKAGESQKFIVFDDINLLGDWVRGWSSADGSEIRIIQFKDIKIETKTTVISELTPRGS